MEIMQNHVSDSDSSIDLKPVIHQHSLYFDKLIDLIPPRFYLPQDDDKPWFQGLSKAERASAKKESKENIKKARRVRLDPDKSSATTLDLLKQNLEKEKVENESEDDEVEINPMMSGLEGDERSVTYEELRQRLHLRIEELRGNWNSGQDKEKKWTERNDRKHILDKKKRKRENISEANKPEHSTSMDDVQRDITEASKELAFGHVKLGSEDKHEKKKKKLSKFEELENAKKLQEAINDPEKGQIISKKHSWKAATSRAAGLKIHDDPKLIKQSIQKEKRKHQKNVEKWKDRTETRNKTKTEKQQKRSENITERIQQKKMRRIAKREKKLMRPGFEGRKEGYINQPSA